MSKYIKLDKMMVETICRHLSSLSLYYETGETFYLSEESELTDINRVLEELNEYMEE